MNLSVHPSLFTIGKELGVHKAFISCKHAERPGSGPDSALTPLILPGYRFHPLGIDGT